MKPASASVFIFILLACSAVVCAAGWFLCSLSRRVLLRFMEKKSCPPPTRQELKECSRETVKSLFQTGKSK